MSGSASVSPADTALAGPLRWDMAVPFESHGDPARKTGTLARFHASGVNAVSLTIARDGQNSEQAMQQLRHERSALLSQAQHCVLASSAQDVLAAQGSGRVAITFNFQGTDPFQAGLHTVRQFRDLGVRHALLVYNTRNAVGGGCHDAPDVGLTPYGARLVQEMNQVGITVDLSHTGPRTALEAIAVSSRPVIVSHALADAVHAHPRNVSDALIRAVAGTGGAVGVSGTSLFLGDPMASTEALLRHIDHLVRLVGPEHVAIGLDFNYDVEAAVRRARALPKRYPHAGYADLDLRIIEPERWLELPDRLSAFGYGWQDVEAILGRNWLRIAAQNWQTNLCEKEIA